MTIQDLTKHHKKWINIAKQFGGCEDEVQDMYIKLIELNKDINTAYVWCTLRSICVDKIRLESRFKKVDLNDVKELVSEDIDIDKFIKFEEIQNKIESIKYKTHYSDVIILDAYYKKGLTIRGIASKFNIAPSTVMRSLKTTKEKIRNEIFESKYQILLDYG